MESIESYRVLMMMMMHRKLLEIKRRFTVGFWE